MRVTIKAGRGKAAPVVTYTPLTEREQAKLDASVAAALADDVRERALHAELTALKRSLPADLAAISDEPTRRVLRFFALRLGLIAG